jgi:hypothetical protein
MTATNVWGEYDPKNAADYEAALHKLVGLGVHGFLPAVEALRKKDPYPVVTIHTDRGNEVKYHVGTRKRLLEIAPRTEPNRLLRRRLKVRWWPPCTVFVLLFHNDALLSWSRMRLTPDTHEHN